MKLGIYVNVNKDKTLSVTAQVSEIAERLGFLCSVLADNSGKTYNEKLAFAEQNDFIMVLGGDGTILRIAAAAASAKVPLLSVNLGHLGFLTEIEPAEIEDGLTRLAAGDYKTESRMMLQCIVGNERYFALNDVCVQRASRARLLNLKVYAGDSFVDKMAADGVLVSSPTGSTAYSLSAGGPIISPNVNVLLMTPICAHTLRSRPFVFAADEEIKIETPDECGLAVITDGALRQESTGQKQVCISKADEPLLMVRLKQQSFYKRLSCKLIEWNMSEEGGK